MYDDNGRLLSSHPEVEWDDGEREWMLALAYYREHLLCPCGCGWPKAISMDPSTEFNLDSAVAHRCHIRTALVCAQKDGKSRPTPEGLMWSVSLREPMS